MRGVAASVVYPGPFLGWCGAWCSGFRPGSSCSKSHTTSTITKEPGYQPRQRHQRHSSSWWRMSVWRVLVPGRVSRYAHTGMWSVLGFRGCVWHPARAGTRHPGNPGNRHMRDTYTRRIHTHIPTSWSGIGVKCRMCRVPASGCGQPDIVQLRGGLCVPGIHPSIVSGLAETSRIGCWKTWPPAHWRYRLSLGSAQTRHHSHSCRSRIVGNRLVWSSNSAKFD